MFTTASISTSSGNVVLTFRYVEMLKVSFWLCLSITVNYDYLKPWHKIWIFFIIIIIIIICPLNFVVKFLYNSKKLFYCLWFSAKCWVSCYVLLLFYNIFAILLFHVLLSLSFLFLLKAFAFSIIFYFDYGLIPF